jgi:AAHS family 4-hydroxybenzoate transporter-like MFS transporter
MTNRGEAMVDVGRVLDEGRWGGYQRWLVFLTALTIIFDGFDNQLLGIALPSIIQDWQVARSAFAPVVSVGYLGMMIGGAVAGLAGDRFGRRVALLGSLLIFGAATLAVSGVGGLPALAVLRLISGLGLGGAIPNATALAAEYVPRRQRPLAVSLAIVCVPVGGTVAGLTAVPGLPAFGWRGMFMIGGLIPVVLAFALWRLLPESPRYLARHRRRWPELTQLLRRMGHAVQADAAFADLTEGTKSAAPLKALFGRDLRGDTFALWTAYFSSLVAVYLVFSWLPSILSGAGLGAAVASTGLTVFNLGGVVGAIAGGAIIARAGSRSAMLAMTAGAVVGALVLGQMAITAQSAVMPIIVMLAITGGFINAVQVAMYALTAHVYPTTVRATGIGTAVAFGRLGTVLSGYAGPWALAYGGSASFFHLMAVSMLLTFVALAVIRRHIAGRSHINQAV